MLEQTWLRGGNSEANKIELHYVHNLVLESHAHILRGGGMT